MVRFLFSEVAAALKRDRKTFLKRKKCLTNTRSLLNLTVAVLSFLVAQGFKETQGHASDGAFVGESARFCN